LSRAGGSHVSTVHARALTRCSIQHRHRRTHVSSVSGRACQRSLPDMTAVGTETALRVEALVCHQRGSRAAVRTDDVQTRRQVKEQSHHGSPQDRHAIDEAFIEERPECSPTCSDRGPSNTASPRAAEGSRSPQR